MSSSSDLAHRLFPLLVENLKEYAVYTTDLDGLITSWTSSVERLLCYNQQEFVGQPVTLLYTTQEVETGRVQQEMEAAAKYGEAESKGWRQRKDGECFLVSERVVALRDENHCLEGFARILHEEPLRQRGGNDDNDAAGWLHTALNVGRIGTWVWDISNDKVTADANLAGYFGVSPQDADGGPLGKYTRTIHPDDLESVENAINKSLTDGGVFAQDYRILKGDGSILWMEARGKIELDEKRQPIRLNGVILDISERKKAEEALRESEERYRSLFSALDNAFCVIELIFDAEDKPCDYKFVEVNAAFEQQTGLKNAVGHTIRELVPDLDDYWYQTYGRVAKTGESIRFQSFAEAMDRWFDVYAFRFGPAENHTVALLFTDITDRKAAEESLLQAHLKAEKTNRIKDEFLATLSHELRTPLNAILGWSHLLRTEELDQVMTTQGLETIERNARAQSGLIDDLLDVSRILSGKLRLELEPVDLSTLLEESIKTVAPAAQVKNITLKTDFKVGKALVSGDPDRMSQIFWNLLTNAVKFTPKDGLVEISLSRDDSQYLIRFSDTGQGIEPEFLPHVFDRFRQADSSSTRRFGGLGIGLGLVRHLTEAHGGSVSVFSEGEGCGSVFTVSFPIMAVRPELEKEATESLALESSLTNNDAPEATMPLLLHLRVLVVDDEPDARTLTRIAIEKRGATVEEANSAESAFEKILQSRKTDHLYDVLVSDIGMPQEDGLSLMRRLRTLEREEGGFLPAIALTAYASHKDHTNSLMAGFQIHVSKPVEAAELIAAIASLKGLI